MNLKDYIKNNREAFDCQEPSGEIWHKITSDLSKNPAKTKSFIHLAKTLRIAAGIVLLLGIGYLIGLNVRSAPEPTAEIAVLSPVYAKQVRQYTAFISEKQTELSKLSAQNPALLKEFQSELSTLEQHYQSLKNELPNNPNQEELLSAMVKNLQWQMNILNQQLHIIHQIKQATDEKSKELV